MYEKYLHKITNSFSASFKAQFDNIDFRIKPVRILKQILSKTLELRDFQSDSLHTHQLSKLTRAFLQYSCAFVLIGGQKQMLCNLLFYLFSADNESQGSVTGQASTQALSPVMLFLTCQLFLMLFSFLTSFYKEALPSIVIESNCGKKCPFNPLYLSALFVCFCKECTISFQTHLLLNQYLLSKLPLCSILIQNPTV